jgi:heterodisulfide reductase subunit C
LKVSEDSKPIVIGELDRGFRDDIAREHGGENIRRCFTCGTCTVTCPVFAVEPRYDPRKIIRMILLGMREEVLTSDLIWLCSGCYSCYELCPRDVKITSVMAAARNLAVKEGHIPPGVKGSVDYLEKFGRLLEVSEFENTVRTKSEIPEMKETIPEIRELMAKLGLLKLVMGGGQDE